MKRDCVNLHQSREADEEFRAKLKHRTLLQEYLQVQKEFVSKKRKLQTQKQNRDTLLAEVWFLRRRRRYLMKNQSPKLGEDVVQPQNPEIPRKMLVKKRNYNANGAPSGSPYPVLVSNSDPDSKMPRKMLGKKGNHSVNGAPLGNSDPVLVANPDMRVEEEGEERE